ncbi:UNVERIFIED_CONTAM: hypothetical protein H355_008512 [Colinus virginianus]|nr:hypothetical protein H355_008512 [Colinus virginianus]
MGEEAFDCRTLQTEAYGTWHSNVSLLMEPCTIYTKERVYASVTQMLTTCFLIWHYVEPQQYDLYREELKKNPTKFVDENYMYRILHVRQTPGWEHYYIYPSCSVSKLENRCYLFKRLSNIKCVNVTFVRRTCRTEAVLQMSLDGELLAIVNQTHYAIVASSTEAYILSRRSLVCIIKMHEQITNTAAPDEIRQANSLYVTNALQRGGRKLIHQFQVVGRKRPTESEAQPPLYRMRLFARNKVLAVSKFWYLLKKMKKVKKSKGEILAVNELREKRPTYVKNFGIWLRYDSRTGTHNMYKEIRDVSQNGAVSQLYAEMAGRHRALPSNIQIIRVAQLKASQCRRPHMLQLFDSKLKLPAIRRIFPTPKNRKTVFCARKPTLFLR